MPNDALSTMQFKSLAGAMVISSVTSEPNQALQTDETVGPPAAPAAGPSEPRFREPVRGFLAIAIISIFAAEVLAGMSFGFYGNSPYADRIQAIKEVSAILLAPTIALVGAAAGFYFGRSG